MQLFGFIRKNNILPPLPQPPARKQSREWVKDGHYVCVILSKAKDLNERILEKVSQNDWVRIQNGTLSASLPGQAAQDRSLRNDGYASRVEPSPGQVRCNPAYEKITTTCRVTMVGICLMLLCFAVRPVMAEMPTTRLLFNPTPLQIDTTLDPSGVVNLEDGAVGVRPYRTYLPLILTASGQATEVLL
jgi:hypothetical protein